MVFTEVLTDFHKTLILIIDGDAQIDYSAFSRGFAYWHK